MTPAISMIDKETRISGCIPCVGRDELHQARTNIHFLGARIPRSCACPVHAGRLMARGEGTPLIGAGSTTVMTPTTPRGVLFPF